MTTATNPFPKAIERLREKGWTRNPFTFANEGSGKTCIGLAYNDANFNTPDRNPGAVSGADILNQVIAQRFGEKVGVITANDYYIQTEEEAISVLQEASEVWERTNGARKPQT